jgi:hypothetical protein
MVIGVKATKVMEQVTPGRVTRGVVSVKGWQAAANLRRLNRQNQLIRRSPLSRQSQLTRQSHMSHLMVRYTSGQHLFTGKQEEYLKKKNSQKAAALL